MMTHAMRDSGIGTLMHEYAERTGTKDWWKGVQKCLPPEGVKEFQDWARSDYFPDDFMGWCVLRENELRKEAGVPLYDPREDDDDYVPDWDTEELT